MVAPLQFARLEQGRRGEIKSVFGAGCYARGHGRPTAAPVAEAARHTMGALVAEAVRY